MVLMTGPYWPATAAAADLDPDRLNWSELRFHASKFFISIDADVELADIAASDIDGMLIQAGEGTAVASTPPNKSLVFTTEAFGRKTRAAVLLNAVDGATLQRTSHDSGKRNRHRIYRYTDIGAYQKTWWPVSEEQEKFPPERFKEWSKFEEGMRPFAEAVHGEIVIDPGALLYIVGAAPLEKAGDKIEVLAYARKNVHRVQVEVAGIEQIKVKFDQSGGASPGEKKGKFNALKLLVRGEMVDDGDDDDQFELLGLRGDIDIHIDPETRAPLQIKGDVKIAGKATMRLTRLKLKNP
ncbi:MAG: hypothetical protein ACR2QV_02125 [Gammaproteobacteria bacterium]